MVKKQFDTHIQCLQSDWGGEYRKLQSVLNELGIVFRHPCSHTHQQEGRAERKHRSIVEIGLTLLAQASMDLLFSWEAFVSATYLLNRLPTSVLHHFSPFGSLFGYPPDYKFLKIFGCACFQYLQPYNKHKLAFRTSKCLFLGYSPFHKGYRCLHSSGRIYVARSVNFDENSFPYKSLFAPKASSPPQFVKQFGAPAFFLPTSISTSGSGILNYSVTPSSTAASPSSAAPIAPTTPTTTSSTSPLSSSSNSSDFPVIPVSFEPSKALLSILPLHVPVQVQMPLFLFQFLQFILCKHDLSLVFLSQKYF